MLKNNMGFTMVEAIMACGLMGMLAYAFLGVHRMSTQISSDMELFYDKLNLRQQMSLVLSDESICSNSLLGKPLSGNEGSESNIEIRTSPIGGDPNNSGSLYIVGQKFQNKIKINDIIFVYNKVKSEYSIKVILETKSSNNTKTTSFSIPLAISIDDRDPSLPRLLKCYSNDQGITELAMQKSCESFGGTYDSNDKTCKACDSSKVCTDINTKIQTLINKAVVSAEDMSKVTKLDNNSIASVICLKEGKTKVDNAYKCKWIKTFEWTCLTPWSGCQKDGPNCGTACKNGGYTQSTLLWQRTRTNPVCNVEGEWHYLCCCSKLPIECTCTIPQDIKGDIQPTSVCTADPSLLDCQ
ncbi:MAG: hypothetical protein HQK53_11610 [Oligoflexia bacterium]|nr:hypothetical protein [Oligoflexia bacterium]